MKNKTLQEIATIKVTNDKKIKVTIIGVARYSSNAWIKAKPSRARAVTGVNQYEGFFIMTPFERSRTYIIQPKIV